VECCGCPDRSLLNSTGSRNVTTLIVVLELSASWRGLEGHGRVVRPVVVEAVGMKLGE